MPQSFSALYTHLTWSTKGRAPYLRNPSLRPQLHARLGATSRELECPPVLVGGTDDHVHVLAQMGRSISLSDWIKEMKRTSSIWLKEHDRQLASFYWQGGYAAFSVSPSNLPQVERYVKSQEEHHKKMTFQDELRALLKRHGLQWDERHLWD